MGVPKPELLGFDEIFRIRYSKKDTIKYEINPNRISLGFLSIKDLNTFERRVEIPQRPKEKAGAGLKTD